MWKIITFVFLLFIYTLGLSATEYGFLPKKELPNSYKLLPAPPSMITDSEGKAFPAFAQDEAISKQLFLYKKFFNGEKISKKRLVEARTDANYSTDYFLSIFIDPLNISNEDKAKIKRAVYSIITKVVLDAANSTSKAKEQYHRQRPYYYFNTKSCTGDDSSSSKKDLSYPSGHSIRGITVARVLSRLLPNFREELLARGMQYGDSRVICGAHWESDIQASRVLSGFVINKLQRNSTYKKYMKEAREQIGNITPLSAK